MSARHSTCIADALTLPLADVDTQAPEDAEAYAKKVAETIKADVR